MYTPEEAREFTVELDEKTEAALAEIEREGRRLARQKRALTARIRKLVPPRGAVRRDAKYYSRLHDLEVRGLELEERGIELYLDATRTWRQMLLRKQAADKVPDAWAELDRMLYKRERIRQIERDIQLEQFEFWAKTGAWVTP